jgi:hypothetical protein
MNAEGDLVEDAAALTTSTWGTTLCWAAFWYFASNARVSLSGSSAHALFTFQKVGQPSQQSRMPSLGESFHDHASRFWNWSGRAHASHWFERQSGLWKRDHGIICAEHVDDCHHRQLDIDGEQHQLSGGALLHGSGKLAAIHAGHVVISDHEIEPGGEKLL